MQHKDTRGAYMSNSRNNHPEKEWKISDIFRKMETREYPDFITKMVEQVQEWMIHIIQDGMSELERDSFFSMLEGSIQGDPEKLFKDLEWVEDHADLVPGSRKPVGHEDIIVLCLGPADFDDGMRLAVDYSALFGRGFCKRVWMICDSWIIGDVVRYLEHIRALVAEGVSFNFIFVTPWGWSEIPIRTEAFNGGKLDWRSGKKGHSNTSNGTAEDETSKGS